MKWLAVIALMCLGAAPAVSPDEAAKRLDERAALRRAAATQPAKITVGELEALKARLAKLEADNAALKKQLAAATPAKIPVAIPSRSGFAARARASANGKIDAEMKQRIAAAERVDAAVTAYIAAHRVSAEIEQAMWEGKPAIGMELDALRILGNLDERSKSASTTSYQFYPHDFARYAQIGQPTWYTVNIEGGKVNYFIKE